MTKSYRVLKAEPHDFPSIQGVLSDGTLDLGDKDIPVHLINPYASASGKKCKPIWRLLPMVDSPNPSSHLGSNAQPPHAKPPPSSIKPNEMMHVAINYGGLPGFSYVNSLQEFVADINDTQVQELAARRCDLLTDRVYSIGELFKQARTDSLCNEIEMLECLREDIEGKENICTNNELIIRVLSSCSVTEDRREKLLRKLHQQLAQVSE